jgi:hypothetical protein
MVCFLPEDTLSTTFVERIRAVLNAQVSAQMAA